MSAFPLQYLNVKLIGATPAAKVESKPRLQVAFDNADLSTFT